MTEVNRASVKKKDIKMYAEKLIPPTIAYLIAFKMFSTTTKMVKAKGMMDMPYIAIAVKAISALAMITAILLVVTWGFVICLLFVYLLNRGGKKHD